MDETANRRHGERAKILRAKRALECGGLTPLLKSHERVKREADRRQALADSPIRRFAVSSAAFVSHF
ncbi:MAG: hypothetical protein DME33_08365 [Verrucomicrobia bacterium]|nr:MAG: hypothetical protein DME33_08365 [Verrucomicrobiota bacterium]